MTEDEARTKWCPFVRVLWDTSERSSNAAYNRQNESTCIASDCMAWRLDPPPPEVVGPIHGHCGLAGA